MLRNDTFSATLVNPSRADPNCYRAISLSKGNPTFGQHVQGYPPRRLACITFGVVHTSSLEQAEGLTGRGEHLMNKTLALYPLVHEYSRQLAFFYMVFREKYKMPVYAKALNFATIPVSSA